jgi:hypothetical protein
LGSVILADTDVRLCLRRSLLVDRRSAAGYDLVSRGLRADH